MLENSKKFYSLINKFSDKKLHDCNFSREEILEGLVRVWYLQYTLSLKIKYEI
ncbi:DUF6483 family protein [Clostridium paraputrificum]|uniref:DUF6483 family protein n=1 Tax=Clostridium paraputrificum TaxID=29363 RepID=UPI003D3597DF